MSRVLKVFTLTILVGITSCSIGGLTYRDPYPALKPSQGDDPCKPLYWYPKHIPDYCNDLKSVPMPVPVPQPKPMPPPPPMVIPMPMPMPPAPLPIPVPMMMPMPVCGPPMPACGPPMPAYGPPMPAYGPPMPAYGPPMSAYSPPMPAYGSPMQAYGSPMPAYGPSMPAYGPPAYPSIPAPYLGSVAHSGFVPGVEGLVTHDGGINILPFSDVYAEYIEKHKQKMIRIRLQELLDKYDKFPKGFHGKSRKHDRDYE